MLFACVGCQKQNTDENPHEPSSEQTDPKNDGTQEESSEPTESSEQTEITEPSEDTELPDEPEQETTLPNPTEKPVGCNHAYQQTYVKAATCTQVGSKKFVCTKCYDVLLQEIPMKAHTYQAATCLRPETCSICKNTQGDALGHSFGADHLCTRCKAKDTDVDPESEPAEFVLTVRSDEGKVISGITVSVYTLASGSVPAGSAVTDNNGKATISLQAGSKTYRVVLSDVPQGYQANDSYSFSVTQATINLKTLPVRTNPDDHSKARYEKGDKIMEFTLTDIDGKTYQLSELVMENKLIILNFWYVSCKPCKTEFPYFEEALKRYGDDIVLLAIDPFYSAQDITQLRDEMQITFALFQDQLGMAEGFRVNAYPTTVFIDSSGTIREIHINAYPSQEAFLSAVQAYL